MIAKCICFQYFWISVEEEYPAIHRKAINALLPFSTSYICEQHFSCLTSMRSKDRNRLISVRDELRDYLKFDPGLSFCAAETKHRFHMRQVNFILYFSSKINTVIDDIFVHIALIYLRAFSNLNIQHCH
jgi:hypothetical protein